MMRILGIAILAAVFAGFFWATASIDGWRAAATIWGCSLIITAILVLGVFLALGAPR